MSARENLLRKSCRAPADNHFIYVSHRQHSCGKKDLYQRFFTTHENVTLSANTRLPSFLADRQSAVLKRAKEVLGELSAAGSYDLLALSFERPPTSNRRDSAVLLSAGVLFAERLFLRGPTFLLPAIRWLRGGGVRSRGRPRLWDLGAGRRMARCHPLGE